MKPRQKYTISVQLKCCWAVGNKSLLKDFVPLPGLYCMLVKLMLLLPGNSLLCHSAILTQTSFAKLQCFSLIIHCFSASFPTNRPKVCCLRKATLMQRKPNGHLYSNTLLIMPNNSACQGTHMGQKIAVFIRLLFLSLENIHLLTA